MSHLPRGQENEAANREIYGEGLPGKVCSYCWKQCSSLPQDRVGVCDQGQQEENHLEFVLEPPVGN